jgi:hypothetical protein
MLASTFPPQQEHALEDVTAEELNEQYQAIIAEQWKHLAAARAWTKRLEAELFIARRALDVSRSTAPAPQRHVHVELSAPVPPTPTPEPPLFTTEPAGPSPAEQAIEEDKDKTTVSAPISDGHWPNLRAAGFDDFN